MATLNQNGIDFNNISFTEYTFVDSVVSKDSAIASSKGSYVTNAVTIDWNGAQLGTTTINTTGKLLSY